MGRLHTSKACGGYRPPKALEVWFFHVFDGFGAPSLVTPARSTPTRTSVDFFSTYASPHSAGDGRVVKVSDLEGRLTE